MKKEAEEKKDMVNRPAHYRANGVETIDLMKGSMSKGEFDGFLKGNVVKYVIRANYKHDGSEEDLHKALWYLMFLYLENGGTTGKIGETIAYMKEKFDGKEK